MKIGSNNKKMETFQLWFGIILGIQVLIALLIAFTSDDTLPPLSQHMIQRREDVSMIYFNVMTIGTLLWPVLWVSVVGIDLIKDCPLAFLGLLWPFLLGIFQLYDIFYDRCEDIRDHQQQRATLIGGVHVDTSTVVSFAFASATLLWSIGNLGLKLNLIPSARLIMATLLLSVSFVIPTQNFIDNNQRYSVYVRVGQRVCVNYATGFLLTALIIILSNCVKNPNVPK